MEHLGHWVVDYTHLIRLQGESRMFPKPPKEYIEHKPGKSPIILIPGILEQWGFLRKIANAASGNGHNIFTVPDLHDNLFSIQESVKIVTDVITKNGLHNVIVIAHSKGGLIGKQLLVNKQISKLIAIATPFGGSDVAGLVPFKPFQELVPLSQTILDLSKNSSVNSDITSVFPQFDNHSSNGSTLSGAENILIPVNGHHKILQNNRVIEIIKQKLDFWEAELLNKVVEV